MTSTRGMRQPLSVRTHMLGLILVTVLPLLAFSAFLVLRAAEHEQAIMAGTVQRATAAIAREVEQELATQRSQLFVAADAVVAEGDLAALRVRVRAMGAGDPALTLVVSRPDGAEVLNTGISPDVALPDNPDPDAIRRVIESGLPYIADLTTDPATQAHSVMINVPVMRGHSVAYVASLDVMPVLREVLARQSLPAGWLATIDDSRGYTLARSQDAEKYIGQRGRPEFWQRLGNAANGAFEVPSREGIPLYSAFSRLAPAGWVVVVGMPLDVLYGPVRQSTRVLLAMGGATLALALALAVIVGGRVARPITRLARYAEAIGQGALAPPVPTRLRETDTVAASLHRGAEDLGRSLAAQQQAAAALQASEERTRLLHQAVLAQEAERKRIARELHDSLGQYLTAFQLGLSAMGRRLAADPEAPGEVAKLRELTVEIGREVSRMARELRPTVLDDLGLEKAVTQYLEEWGERLPLQFDLQVSLGDHRLPQAVETVVYRALQEAITNVVRHADAERVGVILEATGRQVQLIVEDDGKGLPVDEAGGGEQTLRLGLVGMRERLALVDGSLEVESVPGRGTTLFVRVPV